MLVRESIKIRRHAIICFALVGFANLVSLAKAEYPALSAALNIEVDRAAQFTTGIPTSRTEGNAKQKRVLVYVRDSTSSPQPWRLRAAVQTEIVSGLRQRKIDATEIDLEAAETWLLNCSLPLSQEDYEQWRKTTTFDALLMGQLIGNAGRLGLTNDFYFRAKMPPIHTAEIRLDETTVALEKNTPAFNRKVLDFISTRVGKTVGNGDSAAAIDAIFEQLPSKRRNLFHWGRQLGEREAWLPGDIVQLEGAKFIRPDGTANGTYPHHSAVVQYVISPNTVGVLMQDSGATEKGIARHTWNLDELKSGSVVFFRPLDVNTPLPANLMPRRRVPAPVFQSKPGQVDLMKTIDPFLDSVSGVWRREGDFIIGQSDKNCRLQIPVDPPNKYTLKATVKRTNGNDAFGMGLIVGGKQVHLALDAVFEEAGTFSGLQLVDGKRVSEGPSAFRGNVLPLNAAVKIEVRVTINSVKLLANDKAIYTWQGDPELLSLPRDLRVPQKEWLFLSSNLSNFQISELVMTTR